MGFGDGRVIVLGAGVAGLAVAGALRLAGFEVRVVERRPMRASMGAGVVLWQNGLGAARQLDILGRIERRSGSIGRIKQLAPSGAEQGVVELAGRSILRRDLLGILEQRALELGACVDYGCDVAGIQALEDGTGLVCFSSGACKEADLVVGADGRIHSPARRFVTQAADAGPRYSGFVNLVGVFESDAALFAEGDVLDFRGETARFGVVPLSARLAYWAAACPATLDEQEQPDAVLERLRRELARFAAPIPRILAGAGPEPQQTIWVHDLDPITCWHRGNVVLVGDAAHASLPTSGQGASQALIDAVALTAAIREHGTGEATLVAFTRGRRPETTAHTQRARTVASALFKAA